MSCTPTFRSLVPPVAALLVLLTSAVAWPQTDTVTFSRGSLIIPSSASFQTSCGVISAYGMVWRILQSNQAGHFNANHPVTVYWAINAHKTSPNRCVPTNLTPAPSPNDPGPSGATNNWDDQDWNDGCDVSICNVNQMPVVPVNYSVAFPAGGFYPPASISLLDTSAIGLPSYAAQTVNNSGPVRPLSACTPFPTAGSGGGGARFVNVQYGGGPFIIDVIDAANVVAFLKTGSPAAGVPLSAISPFTTACACGNSPSTTCHYVAMHQANADFTVTVGKRLNQIPPKIALLDEGVGVKWCPGFGSCGGQAHVLDTYLENAGLLFIDNVNHTSSGGCPVGSRANCSLNGSTAGPGGTKYPGQIYDQFNANLDLISTASDLHGLINLTNILSQPVYRILWTPHWETNTLDNYTSGNPVSNTGTDGYPDLDPVATNSSNGPVYTNYVANGDGATTQRQNALNNVAFLLGRQGTGLMAECASIAGYEGDPNNSITGGPITAYSTSTAFMYTAPGITSNNAGSPWDGRNCTDPNYSSGQCMLWPRAPNPYAQIGDWHFTGQIGTVGTFGTRTPVNYKPGVLRLGLTWNNYVSTDSYLNPPDVAKDSQNGWDILTFVLKDNNSNKGAAMYIGGHEYTTSTVGNRIILNTLMNLGYSPVGSDRALTEPIAFKDSNYPAADARSSILITGAFSTQTGFNPGADIYDPANGSNWLFPITPGHLRAATTSGLLVGEQALNTAAIWDAANNMPLPHDRNIFTYFGGRVLSGSTTPTLTSELPAGSNPPHGILQVDWIPERVAGTAITSTYTAGANPNCVDVMQYGQTPDGAFGLIRGSDGVCDLQEATEYTVLTRGIDFGAAEWTANKVKLLADFPNVAQMLQAVRGYCFATTTRSDGSGTAILEPAIAQCNNGGATDLATLGGIVRSTPAVVGSSINVDNPLHPRPTVVYAGGHDGQLHAIYVSGGGGYTGPLRALSYPPTAHDATWRADGTSNFVTDWSARFSAGGASLPIPGTELWSFLPATQLPMLKTNNARVDSSPAVIDVFVDLRGTGIREWHTVVVATIGKTGREMFALDISNPLKPVLLWDLVGSVFPIAAGYPPYSPVPLVNKPIGVPQGIYSTKWLEPTALFRLAPAVDPGRVNSGYYDYSDLGGSLGLSIGQMRIGLNPVYGVFAATNNSGASSIWGEEVYAVDLATGQKVWQWEEPYTQAWVSNTIPASATVTVGWDGIRRVYAGEMEGRLWELDALTGVNVNNANDPALPATVCPTPPCNYAAFDTGSTLANPQPITTNIAVAKIPPNPDALSALAPFPNATVVSFGTSGVDWVYTMGSPAGSVAGKFHVLLNEPQWQVPYLTGARNHLDGVTPWTLATARSAAATSGAFQEAVASGSSFPIQLSAGETVYGSVITSGQITFFGTTFKPIGDIKNLNATLRGATHYVDLGSAVMNAADNQFAGLGLANFGGVTIVSTTVAGVTTNYVMGLEVSKISVSTLNATANAHASANAQLNIRSPVGVFHQLKGFFLRLFNL